MLKLYTHKAMNFHNTIYTQTFNIGKTHWKEVQVSIQEQSCMKKILSSPQKTIKTNKRIQHNYKI